MREAKHVRKAKQYHFVILMRTVLVRFRQPNPDHMHDSKKQQVDDGPVGSYQQVRTSATTLDSKKQRTQPTNAFSICTYY